MPGRITFYQAGEPHQILNMCQSVHINLEMTQAFLLQSGFAEATFGSMLDKTPDARLFSCPLGAYMGKLKIERALELLKKARNQPD